MKKPFILFLLLNFSLMTIVCFGQEEEKKSRERLRNLLDERKEKFSKYTDAIEKRSGIFGNQTKKDVKAANEILVEIVKTDNVLMKEMRRILDQKTYEKTDMSYDLGQIEEQRQKFLEAIESLTLRNEKLSKENEQFKREIFKLKFLSGFFLSLFLITIVLIVVRRIQRRRKQAA